MALVLITAPATEPVTLAEVKGWLRIDEGTQEPAPDDPTAALSVTPGNVDNGAHRYLVTFVTAGGETQAGTPSNAVTVVNKAVAGQVSLTSIQLGGSAVTARRIYRTAAGGTVYLLLATIANNTATTYTDNTADAGLGAGAPDTNTTDDPLLNMLIKSARAAAETITRRAFVTQTWELVRDCFPGWEISIPKPVLQSITSIIYTDADGIAQTLDASTYQVDTDSEPARIAPSFGQIWPVTRYQMSAVRVRFVAGYGAASLVPEGIKNWMQMRIATLWENRAELVVDARVGLIVLPPAFIDGLLDPYRVDDFSWVDS